MNLLLLLTILTNFLHPSIKTIDPITNLIGGKYSDILQNNKPANVDKYINPKYLLLKESKIKQFYYIINRDKVYRYDKALKHAENGDTIHFFSTTLRPNYGRARKYCRIGYYWQFEKNWQFLAMVDLPFNVNGKIVYQRKLVTPTINIEDCHLKVIKPQYFTFLNPNNNFAPQAHPIFKFWVERNNKLPYYDIFIPLSNRSTSSGKTPNLLGNNGIAKVSWLARNAQLVVGSSHDWKKWYFKFLSKSYILKRDIILDKYDAKSNNKITTFSQERNEIEGLLLKRFANFHIDLSQKGTKISFDWSKQVLDGEINLNVNTIDFLGKAHKYPFVLDYKKDQVIIEKVKEVVKEVEIIKKIKKKEQAEKAEISIKNKPYSSNKETIEIDKKNISENKLGIISGGIILVLLIIGAICIYFKRKFKK